MAKLVLTIQPKDEGALKSVQALKAEVQSLSKSLSSIKITSSGVETTRKGYANLITTLKTLKSQYADGVFGNLPQDAERAFKKIQEISAAFQESGKLTKEQAKAYAQLSQQLKKYTADLATVKAKNDKIVAANPFTVTQAQQIPRLIKQYSTLLTTLRNTEKYYPKGTFDTFKADLTQGQQELQALNNEFLTTGTLSQDSQVKLNNLANSYNQLNASIAQTTSTMKSSKGGLLDIVTGFAKFQLSAMLVMKPLQWIRSALTSINETLVKTEDAVIALQRVLPSGSATDSEISSRLYKIAADYGQTFENVSQIATNFARTGMSWADTIKATEAAVLALNVAELDAEEATTGLIAILSQFNLEASDLETVIDKLNKTADNFPVTTEKILAALQRTGSAASNANLTLDQTIALITALSKATGRSGENIGTALNSLIQYSSKASALDTFAALSDESAAVVERFRQGGATILDVWRQVSEEIKNLKSDQADLLDQYFSTEDGEALKDALDGELQDIYTELGGVYDTANTFRKNYFIALLGNMDTVEQAMGTLGDAAGYSQKENEKYLNTYTAKLNKVKAQWEDIANSEQGILGIKKALVDVGSVLLTIIKWTGGLRTVLLAISTVVWMLVGDKIISGFKAIGTALKGLVTGFRTVTTAAQGFQAALGAIGAIATVISIIVGVIQQAADEDKQARQEIIEDWKAIEDEARNVAELYNKLDELSKITEKSAEQQNEFLSVEKELAKALGYSAYQLKGLTEGTDEYTEALKKATQEKLKLYLLDAQAAQNAQNTNFNKSAPDKDYKGRYYQYLDDVDVHLGGSAGAYNDARFVEERLKSAILEEFPNSTFVDNSNSFGIYGSTNRFQFNELSEFIANWLYDNGFGETDLFTKIEQFYKDEYNRIIEQLTAFANTETIKYLYNNGMPSTQSDIDSIVDIILEATGATESWRDEVDSLVKDFIGFNKTQQEVSKETNKWSNNIKDVTDKYDDLIKKLEELRDAEKESLELEEKKKAVLEAQKALEDARNEATVRRFNETTGQWEWQTDEKAIAEAEENLEKARQDLEEQAYDTIIDTLENKTATNDGLNELLNSLKEYLGDDFISAIKAAILRSTNVDLDKPINNVNDGQGTPAPNPSHPNSGGGSGGSGGGGGGVTQEPYDNGGAAIGKGLMRKATDKDETVNGPDLTEKILSPVSNAHFDRWVHDMGLLFETSRQYAQAPVIERLGGATDNRIDNSGQIIMNGVTIGSDKRSSSLDEILFIGGNIVPNV